MRHLISSMAAAAILLAAGLPAAAQSTGTTQSPSAPAAPNGAATHTDVSDATVGKVGAALRDVVQIKQSYRTAPAIGQDADRAAGSVKAGERRGDRLDLPSRPDDGSI